jgi:hypothetical protein
MNNNSPLLEGASITAHLPTALQDDEYDQRRNKQNGDLYAGTHEHGAAAAIFRVVPVASSGVVISSGHQNSWEN